MAEEGVGWGGGWGGWTEAMMKEQLSSSFPRLRTERVRARARARTQRTRTPITP